MHKWYKKIIINVFLLSFLGVKALELPLNYVVLNQFTQASDYYVSFNSGTGTLNSSTVQGSNFPLALNYNVNSSASFSFTVFKNYHTTSRDYTFLNKGFFVVVKSNQQVNMRLRLWEDVLQNGTFSQGDEVYASKSIVLNSRDWTLVYFDISHFERLTGEGNHEIDLNRIRAWDIEVFSDQGVSNLDWGVELFGIVTDYVVPPTDDYTVKGAFIQLWNDVGCACGNWSEEQWTTLFNQMEALCMTELVVQYSVYEDLAWYQPTQLDFVQYSQPTLNKMFNAAAHSSIKISLGMYFSESWNHFDKSAPQNYSALLQKHELVINELNQLFGAHPSFGNWYIPQEINDLEWQQYPEKNLLFNWLDKVSSSVYNLNPEKTIFFAPFFNLWQPADQLALWYDELFKTATHIGAIYPQDGVGIQLKRYNYHVPLYFTKLKKVAETNGVTFGATVENFEQLTGWPVSDGGFSAQSASLDRFTNQIAVAKSFTPDQTLIFSWSYMQPNGNTFAQQLYIRYENELTNCLPLAQVNVAHKKLNFYPNPTSGILHFNQTQDWVKIYDLRGNVVYQTGNVKQIQINLSAGVYMLETSAGISKLIVN